MGIVSVTVKVLYLFCAKTPERAGIKSRIIKMKSWLNFKDEIRFLIAKSKFTKCFYQVHKAYMKDK